MVVACENPYGIQQRHESSKAAVALLQCYLYIHVGPDFTDSYPIKVKIKTSKSAHITSGCDHSLPFCETFTCEAKVYLKCRQKLLMNACACMFQRKSF